VRFVFGDLHALPLADGCADVAVCGLALTHVTELLGPVTEIARIVRPGGSVVVSDLHPVAAALGGQAQPARPDGTHMLARNEVHWASEYVAAFREAGLEIERMEEPLVDRAFLESIEHAGIRDGLEAAVGLPVALVWLLRRR
jgi:ubiquinone/menaquinone biosynthesis C-methylase UbiE